MVATTLAFLALGGHATPLETVKRYVDAWNRRDVPAIEALLIGTDHASRVSFPQDSTISFTVTNATVYGDEARVRLNLFVNGYGTFQDGQIQDRVDLRRVGGVWKLAPIPAADPAAFLHVLQWLGSSTFESTDQLAGSEIDASPGNAALWDARHIASAMLRYRATNGRRFMRPGADVHKLLFPFLMNDRFWSSPRPGYAAFAVNEKLLGLSASDLHDPDHTILVYEGANGRLGAPKGRAAAVAFASGRVQFVDVGDERRLRWTP